MKYIYIIVVIVINQIISANAANYNRVERQVINTNEITNQVSRIIDSITRFSNPRNMFQWLSNTFNSVMRVLDPSNVLGRGRREVEYTRAERDLHDYLVKVSKESIGSLVKIHDHVDLDDEFNWKVAHIPEKDLPELPPISGITTNSSKPTKVSK